MNEWLDSGCCCGCGRRCRRCFFFPHHRFQVCLHALIYIIYISKPFSGCTRTRVSEDRADGRRGNKTAQTKRRTPRAGGDKGEEAGGGKGSIVRRQACRHETFRANGRNKRQQRDTQLALKIVEWESPCPSLLPCSANVLLILTHPAYFFVPFRWRFLFLWNTSRSRSGSIVREPSLANYSPHCVLYYCMYLSAAVNRNIERHQTNVPVTLSLRHEAPRKVPL